MSNCHPQQKPNAKLHQTKYNKKIKPNHNNNLNPHTTVLSKQFLAKFRAAKNHQKRIIL
jgi:hypothetical protein